MAGDDTQAPQIEGEPQGLSRLVGKEGIRSSTPIRGPCPSTCSPWSSTGWLARGSLYVNHLAWPDDELFRTRAERTLRSAFADCSTWPVGIQEGRGWHAAGEEPGNVLFRCRKSAHDGDQAIYSGAVPRADLDRSLR